MIVRTPDEIMTVVDQAQKRLGTDFDLRSLIWEILEDVLDTIYLTCDETKKDVPALRDIPVIVEDYLGNHYGDD